MVTIFGRLRLALAVLAVSLAAPSVSWAQPRVQKLESVFVRLEAQLDSLQQQKEQKTQRVQLYSEEIRALEAKGGLNYFQRQKLEERLKKSQALSREIEQIEQRMRELRVQQDQVAEQLLQAYDAEIAAAVQRLEKEARSATEREALASRIAGWRERQAALRVKFSRPPTVTRLPRLSIDPDDTPKQIEQKADLLKDQEDKLRRVVLQLQQQRQELRSELELRTRINEMASDLALWDQQEEAVTPLGGVRALGEGETLSGTPLVDLTGGTEGQAVLGDNLVVGKDFDVTTLSLEQLEAVLATLERQRQEITAKADSLGRLAEQFYQIARQKKQP